MQLVRETFNKELLMSMHPLTIAFSLPGQFSTNLKNSADQAYGGAAPTSSVSVIIGSLIAGVLSLLGLIFLCLVVYAGFLWMTAQGDTKKVNKAKDILINGVVGLLITLSAYIIADWVTTSLADVVAIAPFIHSTALSVRDILFS